MEELQELAALACRILLGLVFLRSSVAKLPIGAWQDVRKSIVSVPWIVAIGALWLVVLVLGVLVLGLLRRVSAALIATENRVALLGAIGFGGLRSGESLPAFRALTTDGAE